MQVTTRAVDPSAVTLATLTGMPCTAVHRRPPDRVSGDAHALKRPVTRTGAGRAVRWRYLD